MAFYRVNTARAREGKNREARQAGLALAQHAAETHGADVQILHSHDGPSDTLHWVHRFASWAEYEETGPTYAQDERMQELIAACAEVIDLHNSVWHTYEVVEE